MENLQDSACPVEVYLSIQPTALPIVRERCDTCRISDSLRRDFELHTNILKALRSARVTIQFENRTIIL